MDFISMRRFTINEKFYIIYNKIRRKNLLLIAEIFEKRGVEIPEEIVISLEESIYDKVYSKKNKYFEIWDENFIFLYTLYSSKITKNIDCDDMYLINSIINKTICVKSLISFKSYKLAPLKTEQMVNRINERISIADQDIIQKTSSLYKCKVCGNRKVIIQEVVMRSLDEATNSSLTCVVCNNKWVAN